jgi:hypothetical protein
MGKDREEEEETKMRVITTRIKPPINEIDSL